MPKLGYLAMLIGAILLTSPASAGERNAYNLLALDGHYVKWGGPQASTEVTVTYALTKREASYAGAFNCKKMLPISRTVIGAKFSDALLQRELEAAFAMWSRVARINFVAVADEDEADIVIGAQTVPRGRAYTNVAYKAHGPNFGSITRSLICLNPETAWKTGFDGDVEVFDLRYTLAHEIGHAIGLDHPAPAGQVMGFRYDEAFDDLQEGDIQGAIALYGPRLPAGPAKLADITVPASAEARR
jgi:predicted Zn-dependent protease